MNNTDPKLIPLTDSAQRAIQAEAIILNKFPFRIGRESRAGVPGRILEFVEKRKSDKVPLNDLYLIDEGKKLNISREHFLIDREQDGSFTLKDRGSTCGTFVDETCLEGREGAEVCVLKEGSVITVGTSESPYLFKFVLS